MDRELEPPSVAPTARVERKSAPPWRDRSGALHSTRRALRDIRPQRASLRRRSIRIEHNLVIGHLNAAQFAKDRGYTVGCRVAFDPVVEVAGATVRNFSLNEEALRLSV